MLYKHYVIVWSLFFYLKKDNTNKVKVPYEN